MSHEQQLLDLAKQVGFHVETTSDTVKASKVPCVLKNRVTGTCTITKSFDPATGNPDGRIGGQEHVAQITTDGEGDGKVYQSNDETIGNVVNGDGKTWSHVSIKRGRQDAPEMDESAHALVRRYAMHIVGAARDAQQTGKPTAQPDWPFKIPNHFEPRAGLAPVQNRIRRQSVAIIGLGGTGSYILDIMAKVPVEIHLLDTDKVQWHNLMRAPGAPDDEQIARISEGTLLKVDYYRDKYAAFREAIHSHPIKAGNEQDFEEFLKNNPVQYAFVCIDQLTEGGKARQDAVYEALNRANVPFVDSGVSIVINGDAVTGSITTSAYEAGSKLWERTIPDVQVYGELPGYRNVQMPEVNAAAAALAVMEWRRRTCQYASENQWFFQKMRLEDPRIIGRTEQNQ